MFSVRAGWQVVRSQDAVELAAPDGKIVVHEGLHSAGLTGDLVTAMHIPGFRLEPGSVEHVVTCEGELGLVAAGQAGEAILKLGFVLADDTYTRVIGRAASSETAGLVASVVRDIVISTRMFLGNPRRRRFRYVPPAGWRHKPNSSGEDTWLAPDYPTHPRE